MKNQTWFQSLSIDEIELLQTDQLFFQDEEHAHNITKKRETDKKFLQQRRKDQGLGPDVLGLNSLHANKESKSFLEHILTAKRWTPAE